MASEDVRLVTDALNLKPAQIALLRQIEATDVGWKGDLSGRISYRLWSTEHDYKIVTPKVQKLVGLGLAKRWHNPSNFGRGGVELTPLGHEALKEHADG